VIDLRCGDATEELRKMSDDSVDLILTDPPYFRVKGEWWDRQWNDSAAFLSWLAELADEWRRVLKPNGTLYVFASPQMAARVEVMLGDRFNVLRSIRWVKGAGWHKKADPAALRMWQAPWEAVIMCEQFGADGWASGETAWDAKCDELRSFVFEPLRAYLEAERIEAGVHRNDCDTACGFATPGGMASRHYFSRSQWQLPTAEHYAALRNLFGPDRLRREYEDLRREYEDLRRPFHAELVDTCEDTWTDTPVSAYPGKHPCEKPATLLERIIAASSRPGATVLDCFAGSGATLFAADRLGRDAIGVEIDARWCDQINRATAGRLPFTGEAAA